MRLAAAAIAWLLIAGLWFASLTAPQGTWTEVDSITFLEIAKQPLSSDHLAYPKPFTTPAVYRLVDAHTGSIVTLQRVLAFVSWSLFGAALVALQRRNAARIAAAVVALALLLAPVRVGFTGAILSESIADSLFALVAAGALGLARLAPGAATSRRARGGCLAIAAALALVTPLWILSRDINAVAVLFILAVAAAWWRPWRGVARWPWAPVLAAIALVVAVVGLRSSGQVPARPTHLAFHADWLDEARPRDAYPMINNLFHRVLPDPDAVAFFRARGLPMIDELERFRGQLGYAHGEVFLTDPHYLPVHRWLRANGTRTYLLWRMRHPVVTVEELGHSSLSLIGAASMTSYMPRGWQERGGGFLLADAFRWWTASWPTVLLVLALTPLAFHRARGPARGVAACAMIAGFLGAVATVLADASEVRRHAWGMSQMLLVGAVVVVLAALEAWSPRVSASRRSDPRPADGDR